MERLIAGDPDAEHHFSQYFGDLLSLKLRSRLRSREQIEDAKQETFARVLTSLKRKGGVQAPEALGAFVNSVCNNVVFEMYRAGSRALPLEEDFDAADERQPSAETAIGAGEDRHRVRAALVALPPKERELLTWLFFEARDPLDSVVVLSGPDDRFKLYARDVAALRLNAELVTISACRSAGDHAYRVTASSASHGRS